MTSEAGADASTSASGDADRDDPVALSTRYVRATKTDDGDVDATRRALAALDPRSLADALDDDRSRLAFWLNVYNASVQDHLSRNPSLFDKRGFPPTRPIFRRDLVTVAGEAMSVDDVEHGILRRSRSGVGLGYVPRLRTSAFERRHRVDDVDPRIHFALNCGAAACPPVLAYHADDVDAQLDAATRSYLEAEVEYERGAGVARVPKLFSWYRGDFGGTTGIRRFLREHDAVPEGVDPDLAWRDYDWTLKLGTFADD
jgi:hypothetical protein